jgi:hypothetical protein
MSMSNNKTKICNSCKEEKSLNEFNNKTRKTKNGSITVIMSRCKICRYNEQIEYRKNNAERLKIRDAAYNLTVAKKRRQQEIDRLAIPENRKKRQDYVRTYKAERRKVDPSFKLYNNIGSRIRACLIKKSNSSKKYLGCDIHFYAQWLEYTMEEDMTWENYGTLWNIDHVIPISTFDIENHEEALKAFNWKNTCARYAFDNFSKGAKIIEEHNLQQKKLLETLEMFDETC